MQVSLFPTVVALLLGSNVVLASAVDMPARRQAKQETAVPCEYKVKTFASCAIGNGNRFCSGYTDICSSTGKTDHYDRYATRENELACENQGPGDTCTQTVQCC